MIFAIRMDGQTRTLVELLDGEPTNGLVPVSTADAVRWVSAGKLHETGFWIDVEDGRRVAHYAEPEL